MKGKNREYLEIDKTTRGFASLKHCQIVAYSYILLQGILQNPPYNSTQI